MAGFHGGHSLSQLRNEIVLAFGGFYEHGFPFYLRQNKALFAHEGFGGYEIAALPELIQKAVKVFKFLELQFDLDIISGHLDLFVEINIYKVVSPDIEVVAAAVLQHLGLKVFLNGIELAQGI